MSLSEQKEKLHQLIREADEETTAKAMDFFQHLNKDSLIFSEGELAEFRRRSQDHDTHPERSRPWDEVMADIRNKLKQ